MVLYDGLVWFETTMGKVVVVATVDWERKLRAEQQMFEWSMSSLLLQRV